MYVEAGMFGRILEHPKIAIARPGAVMDMLAIFGCRTWNTITGLATSLEEPAHVRLRVLNDFLKEHRHHKVEYWHDEQLPDDLHLTWLKMNGLPSSSARFYVEVLKMTSWEQVVRWREALGRPWNSGEDRDRFHQAFEEHLARFQRGAES